MQYALLYRTHRMALTRDPEEKFLNFPHTWGIGNNGASPKVRQNRLITDHVSFITNSVIAFSIGVFSYKRLISGLI